MNKCPHCKHRFSEWFVWDGGCYCFLCWRSTRWRFTETGKIYDSDNNFIGQEKTGIIPNMKRWRKNNAN